MHERVYVTADCKLMFAKILKIDEGVYSCYKRNTRFVNQWQTTAYASYRLKIEASSIKFPILKDVILGLAIISVWALILTFVWILLSFWSFEVIRFAKIESSERKRRREMELKIGKKAKTRR